MNTIVKGQTDLSGDLDETRSRAAQPAEVALALTDMREKVNKLAAGRRELLTPRPLQKPKEPRSFKMDPDVFAGLERRAMRENRSMNNLVETILWKEVQAEVE